MATYKVTLSFEVIVTCYDEDEAEKLALDIADVRGSNSPINCDGVEEVNENEY